MVQRALVEPFATDYPLLVAQFQQVRSDSEALCKPLATEDYVVQTTAEASPAKWHLAHVTWFFETFVLESFAPSYRPFHPAYRELFNSYYQQVGRMHPRAERGFLSRPTVDEVYAYRRHVDGAVIELLQGSPSRDAAEIARRLRIGIHHEQQHQELLLTDIKRNLSVNPLWPAYREDLPTGSGRSAPPLHWIEYPGAIQSIGFAGEGFCFDNELPRHRVLLQPYRLASRCVTNGEYLEFIEDGGYDQPAFWLADGWARRQQDGWDAPLYWQQRDGEWWVFTLSGGRRLNPEEPVCHVSHYEADAFAAWRGKRLPTEAEWECAAQDLTVQGNLRDSGQLHPQPAVPGVGIRQLYGDVWEHTASPYQAYPGYRAEAGALGEYNGKFMCNQMVLRGGSCTTQIDHVRPSYRNFFYPHERWQFQGIRLAEDAL
jgi:ergothioneine biosynthesis protein EgtB